MKIKQLVVVLHINVRIVCAFAMSLSLIGCGKSHVLHQREGVSRTWTYIDFSREKKPYIASDIVGGEHMNIYKVLGFAGDKFSVVLTALKGDVFFGISGDGVHIEPVLETGTRKKIVTVKIPDSFFTVDISAHPYGEYQLKIQKLSLTESIKME